ncbi:potassium channel family protein [Gramella sp. KN1008]|uniref:potassium channel family protein n=1 Tax=Gramella sp. KN1008 TaxID=2529298 RepID=UPI00103BCD16|nr:potassium channel family protein [Gramella sp. KN1008]TBW28088.1 two pore domain potassium channel family protein [Gramella sp. KN1008]
MEILLLVAGILIYLFTVLDIIQTTLSMQGGGWITSRFSHGFWTIFLRLSGRDGKKKILSHTGYILLISIVLIWVFLLWSSFVLLLAADHDSVINSTTRDAAKLLEKIYYAGFTISTLGVGDYIPSLDSWRIISAIYSFTGLILLTMSVTYFIPVLSAVIEQRKLGIRLSNLGNSPEEILINSWNGKDFTEFTEKINDLSESLVHHSQNHRAYPVIHYFHNWKEKNAVILQLARLHEALYLLKYEIDKERRPDEIELKPLEVAFENYREVITEVTHIKIIEEAPPLAGTDMLRKEGLTTVDRPSMNVGKDLIHTRRLFQTLVRQDGWSWDLV